MTDNIIKLLNLEDSDLIVEGPVITGGKKVLSYIRRLQNKYKHMDEQCHERLEQQLGRKIEFTHSKEYYLLKNYRWLILKNHDDIHYSGKSHYNYKLHRYITFIPLRVNRKFLHHD